MGGATWPYSCSACRRAPWKQHHPILLSTLLSLAADSWRDGRTQRKTCQKGRVQDKPFLAGGGLKTTQLTCFKNQWRQKGRKEIAVRNWWLFLHRKCTMGRTADGCYRERGKSLFLQEPICACVVSDFRCILNSRDSVWILKLGLYGYNLYSFSFK